MRTCVSTIGALLLVVFAYATSADAQDAQEESIAVERVSANELATAINAWSGGAQWWECGAPIKSRAERSAEYAREFMRVAEANKLSPLMMAAIVEQESGYDECQVGKNTRDRVGLPMHPSYEKVQAELGTSERRRAHGVNYFDAGAAQFLWPRASNFNATNGVPLRDVLDEAWSIDMLGRTLSIFRRNAMTDRPGGYVFMTKTGRAVRVPAEAGFFIHHNSPGAQNHQYFWSVRSRGLRLLKAIQAQRGLAKAAFLLARPFRTS
jgi:hypothetical protein